MRSFVFTVALLALPGCMDPGQSENRSKAESARESEALKVFPTTYICGKLEIDRHVSSDIVSATDEEGLLNVAFRRFGDRLQQLGLPLNSAGDTSGSRFRGGLGREDHCKGAAEIELVVSVAPGPPGGPAPVIGRPLIVPYKLTMTLRQGDTRVAREISRRSGEVNSRVFIDPRVDTPSQAAAASVTDDISEFATSLAASLEKGA